MKTCTKCKIAKNISEFGRDSSRRDGLQARCKSCALEVSRAWVAKNRELHNARNRALQLRLRKELIEDLGGKCACCTEDIYEFLQIDHINNDGGTRRAARKEKSNQITFLREHMEELQVLCANCHAAKSSWGSCPHQLVKNT